MSDAFGDKWVKNPNWDTADGEIAFVGPGIEAGYCDCGRLTNRQEKGVFVCSFCKTIVQP